MACRRKPKNHYEALNVGPKASQQEIRLAYELLKQGRKGRGRKLGDTIQTAFDTLSDPRCRRAYDKKRTSPFDLLTRPDGTSRLNSTSLLSVLMLVLIAVAGYVFGPDLRAHFVELETGQMLYWKSTSKPLGVVIDYDVAHSFPEGPEGRAYLIEPPAGPPMWYPASDVNRHCLAR